MGWPRASLFLLAALSALLLGCEGSSSSHFLRYFYTGVTEPGQGLPQFILVGYVDGQLFVQYDSNTRSMESRAPWMEKVDKEDPQYWERNTQLARGWEDPFRVSVETVRNYYNLSKGFHTWQLMYGCELTMDASKRGHWQYAYDGRDYLSFDKETLTWTAVDLPAQNTKRKWDLDVAMNQYLKDYLEKECMEGLQSYLEYGNETLFRTERPEGKVTRQAGFDDTESLVCQAYGFYPKEIELTWRKGGEVLHEDTFHRNTAPYPDGTYHAWLSISIDPKNRDQYRCQVEHASLAEPLVLAWEEPASNLGVILGCVVAIVLLIVSMTAGSYIYFKKCQEGYRAAPREGGLFAF
ncbi:hypothetical protein JRQ81_000001 [Phrynocephalus forsythii]|uniref:Ig-like domain-containing protein n=1 Tax=Phrynocephalus forsythii TaxID=171643 RepID=A0A9Q1APN5_9SAUR|nr:hypothetical protein JRQ81_000001 [Phrynocephalus forsythii]